MAHSFVVASLVAPRPASRRLSSIHDADAFVVGGRAAHQRILILALETMPLGRNVHKFIELIGSVVVPVPADLHATCMNQFRVVWGRRYKLSSTLSAAQYPQGSATFAAAAKQSRSRRSRVGAPLLSTLLRDLVRGSAQRLHEHERDEDNADGHGGHSCTADNASGNDAYDVHGFPDGGWSQVTIFSMGL